MDEPVGPTPEEVSQALLDKRDVMGFAIVRALSYLDERTNAQGWDQQQPMLFVAQRELGEPTGSDSRVDGFQLSVSQVELPPIEGGGPEVADALRVVGQFFGEPEAPKLDDVLAWVLVVEAWSLTSLTDEPKQLGEVFATAYSRTVKRHARRVETRMIMAVDRTGTQYHLVRMRGKPPALLTTGDPQYATSGLLNDALAALMESTP